MSLQPQGRLRSHQSPNNPLLASSSMSKKKMLWGFGGFTVLVLGLIVYGVLTHEEPGLKNPEAAYPKTAFPLSVSGESYTAEGTIPLTSDHKSAMKSAIEDVNSRLDFTVLKMVKPSEKLADWTVTIGVPHDDTWEGPGGNYVLSGDSRTKEWSSCTIQTSNTGTRALLYLTLYHEFGHCLGLDDDEQSAVSIMRPVQVEIPSGAFPPWITDHDKKVLRGLYAP